MTTKLQTAMIHKIATDPMNPANGAPESADETETWSDGIIENAADKGVFTSLLNAGFVWHADSGRDAVCGLTAAGWQEWKIA